MMKSAQFIDRRSDRRIGESDRRDEIARSTCRVIARDGLAHASLRRISKEMKCTTGVISHYFETKDDLLVYTLQVLIIGVGAKLREHPIAMTERRGYRDFLISLLPISTENLEYWRVWMAFVNAALHDNRMAQIHDAAYKRLRDGTKEVLKALAESDQVELDASPDALADTIISFVDGLGVHAALSPHAWPARKQTAQLDQFLGAVLRPVGA